MEATAALTDASLLLSLALCACTTLCWYLNDQLQEERRLRAKEVVQDHALSLSYNKSLADDDSRCIYLDYNGTTPVYPDIVEAMLPYFTEHYGNPSSSHILGRTARQAVDQARRDVLYLLGRSEAPMESVWFTSCGTESDNLAIQLAIQAHPHRPRPLHIVTSNVEHPAIEAYLKILEDKGEIRVTYVPVKSDGCVSARAVQRAIVNGETILVTLMLANNETGALQPVKEVAQYCRQHDILCHTDAAQACGKVSVDLHHALGNIDMVSIVGHKLGAPKGVACLYVREGCLNEAGRQMHRHGVMLIGGGQEHGRRAGTDNVPYMVALGKAAVKAKKNLSKNAKQMETLRTRLLENLKMGLGEDNVRANGPDDPATRLPNTLSVGLRNVHSGDLLSVIGDRVASSAGATCHSAAGVSAVLKAMDVPLEFARGTLRLSLGPTTTKDDIDRASDIIIVEACR